MISQPSNLPAFRCPPILISMHLIRTRTGSTWTCCTRWQGRPFRISTRCYRQGHARVWASHLEVAMEAATLARPLPEALDGWVRSLSDRQARKLVEAGILPRHRAEAVLPLSAHLDEYEAEVASRRANTAEHARESRLRVQRAADGIGWDQLRDLDAGDAKRWLRDRGYRPATCRIYLVALRDFGAWLRRSKRTTSNPFAEVEMPRPTPGFDRRPLEVEEVRTLLESLAGSDSPTDPDPAEVDRLGLAGCESSAGSRRLLYWTAVSTGFRRGELAALRRSNLHLDEEPPCISIDAGDAKNRQAAAIPIGRDLAVELADHVAMLAPSARVFRCRKQTCVPELHADLRAAGLGHLLEDDRRRVDFHSLRATAITWWLTVMRLDPLEVMRLARFSSLKMVDKYVRGARRADAWADRIPAMGPARKERQA